ncbi:MAG: lipoyl(octanoyl) transferase LipB [Steroidobacteraceae bacterium]
MSGGAAAPDRAGTAPGPPGEPLCGDGVPTRWLGRIGFVPALALQEEIRRAHAETGDLLLLLEHDPVYTTGRGGKGEHLGTLTSGAPPAAPLERIGRGGDVTYHGPGQLVGYALVDLRRRGRDVHRFLRDLETGVIWTLSALGVRGLPWPGRTGVWVADDGADVTEMNERDMQLGRIRKIASIGIAVRGGITMHGFALNVAMDLAPFAAIVPCGLDGVRMTTVERESVRPVPSLPEVATLAAQHVGRALAWPAAAHAAPTEARA